MEASRASSSSAPVSLMMLRVLPKGRTVLMSFLVMSPAAMEARIPPPLVMATSAFSPSSWAFHSRASAIRSPRLVSWVRLPGSRSPLRSTSVSANLAPYSASISALISAARAAMASSSATVISSVETVSVVMVPSLMVTTPMLARAVPVEVTTVSPTVRSSLVAAATAARSEWE